MNKLFDLIVVALPLIVRFPVISKSPPTVTPSVVEIEFAYKMFAVGSNVRPEEPAISPLFL